MREQDLIGGYLAHNYGMPGLPYSTLSAALSDARWCTDRDVQTAVKLIGQDKHHDRWSGALVYLSLLDQIGEVLELKDATPSPYVFYKNGKPNTFLKALDLFFDRDEARNKALYALRNSFAHDFGLVNINKTDLLLNRHFVVVGGFIEPLVTLPKINWGGLSDARTHENATRVNLQLLGDAIEGIYINLVDLNKRDELRLCLPEGMNELNAKYFQIAWISKA
jgi:hypothetical protein